MIKDINMRYKGTEITFNELLKLKNKIDKLTDSHDFNLFKEQKEKIEKIILTTKGYISDEYEMFDELSELIILEEEFKHLITELRFPDNLDSFEDVSFGVDFNIVKELEELDINEVKSKLKNIIKYLLKEDIIFDLMKIHENEIKYMNDNSAYYAKRVKSHDLSFCYVVKLEKNKDKIILSEYIFNSAILDIKVSIKVMEFKDVNNKINFNELPKEMVERILGLELFI
jgi:hypothetical protein